MRKSDVAKFRERLLKEKSYWEEACKVYPLAKVPKAQVKAIENQIEKIDKLMQEDPKGHLKIE